jgi:hypothetical protein
LLNKAIAFAKYEFQPFSRQTNARLWDLKAQNPCTLAENRGVNFGFDLQNHHYSRALKKQIGIFSTCVYTAALYDWRREPPKNVFPARGWKREW